MPHAVDLFVAWLVPVLIAWFCLSGLDDLFLLVAWACTSLRSNGSPAPPEPAREKAIAIFVPLWQEHDVIRQMVTHNATGIRYRRFEFFIGAYPNDEPTADAVRELESRFPNVHLAMVPHDGPTSKADCLNWIYQHMLIYEEAAGERFDAVLIHDAEDMIHPDSLRAVNTWLEVHDMVQVPVMALPTPAYDCVHGIYIDEFAENQSRDLRVRNRLGGFLPSAGVGTAFRRRAIDLLAAAHGNRVFDPACLTEDYENGFRLWEFGFSQILLPVTNRGEIAATREYFPRRWRAAVRQRTRWATGIFWQGWEKHGWAGGPRQWWWHWRDRKTLAGSVLSFVSNIAFLYGMAGCLWARLTGERWILGELLDNSWAAAVAPFPACMTVLQAVLRMWTTGRYYGWRQAMAAPFRIPVANAINAESAVRASLRYLKARLRGQPLTWLKTSHQYPNRFALEAHRPQLSEILLEMRACSPESMEKAIRAKPPGARLEQWLLDSRTVREEALYEALSVRDCTPVAAPHEWEIPEAPARSLPAHVMRELNVIPIHRFGAELLIASPAVPSEQDQRRLSTYTRFTLRFVLMPLSKFEELRRTLIPR